MEFPPEPMKPLTQGRFLPFQGTVEKLRPVLAEKLGSCSRTQRAELFEKLDRYFCGPEDVCQEFRKEVFDLESPYHQLGLSWAEFKNRRAVAHLIYSLGILSGVIGIAIGCALPVFKGIEPISLITGLIVTVYSAVQLYRNHENPQLAEFRYLDDQIRGLFRQRKGDEEKRNLAFQFLIGGPSLLLLGILGSPDLLKRRWAIPYMLAIPLACVGAGLTSIGIQEIQRGS
jgi:hypothetical protein